MASNGEALQDDFGDYPDWIEILNTSNNKVRLQGWSISDDLDSPRKWTFPDIEIQGEESIVIFASDRNLRDPDNRLHLNFKLKASGEFLGLFDPSGKLVHGYEPQFPAQERDISYGIPMGADIQDFILPTSQGLYMTPLDGRFDENWFQKDFDDTTTYWTESTASVGYESSGSDFAPYILTKIKGPTPGTYLRFPFSHSESITLTKLILSCQSDDGFIAYLNWVPIVRYKAPRETQWDSTATSSTFDRDAIIFKQFDVTKHVNLLQENNVLAVHVLNSSAKNSDLLWVGNLFGSNAGELVTTNSPDYLKSITPESLNASVRIPVLDSPVFNPPGAVLKSSRIIEILHPDPEVEIRFTIDGKIPTEKSRLYTGPLNIRGAQVLTARAFKDGVIASSPTTATYLFQNIRLREWNSNLPVVLIQKQSTAPITGASQSPAQVMVLPSRNGETQWDKPELVSLAAVKVRGSSTANRPKPSLSLEIQDYLGRDLDKSMVDLPAESDWVLWGPYEFDRALMRNPFIYELSRQVGQYAPRTRFVEVFIAPPKRSLSPTEYMGVYAVIEKIKRGNDRVDIERLRPNDNSGVDITGGYIFKVDRLDPGDQGLLAGGQRIALVEPKEEEFTNQQKRYLQDYLNSFQRSITSRTYDEFINVESFVDHHILNELTKNPDEFRLSAYLHKDRDGKVVAGPIWDFDRTMGCDVDLRSFNPVGWANDRDFGWYGGLLRHNDFQQLWIDRYQQFRAGPMSKAKMNSIINEMAAELREPAQRNFEKWPAVRPNNNSYNVEVSQLRSWLYRRVDWIDSLYPAMPELNIAKTTILEEGNRIQFKNHNRTIYYRTDGLDPRLPGGSITPGSRSFRTGASITIPETMPITARARQGNVWSGMFEQVVSVGNTPRLQITEIHYHPPLPEDFNYSEDDMEFIELTNTDSKPVQLHGMTISGGISFTFPTYSMDPGEIVVLAKNPDALESLHPEMNAKIFGPYQSRLSNKEESIVLMDAAERTLFDVTYQDAAPWPESSDGEGFSLELNSLQADPTLPSSWQSSSILNGSPGTMRVAPVEIKSARWEDSLLVVTLSEPKAESISLQWSQNIANPVWNNLIIPTQWIDPSGDTIRMNLSETDLKTPLFIRVAR